MRPIATTRNELRFPLDVLLGTKGQVRVLRLLSESERPMSASEIQAHTGISFAGTAKVLDRLTATGYLTVLGSERSKLYALKVDNPLSESLRSLFEVERARHEELLAALRALFSSLPVPVESAWLAADRFSLGDPLEVGFLTSPNTIDETKAELRHRIVRFQQDFEVAIELSALTRADLAEYQARDIVLLAGYSPFEWRSSFSAASHADFETRSLDWAKRLVRMIERDPTIVSRARRYVDRFTETSPDAATTDLREWHSILHSYSTRQLLELLVDPGERATRLRQSSPFHAVLTEREKLTMQARRDTDDD